MATSKLSHYEQDFTMWLENPSKALIAAGAALVVGAALIISGIAILEMALM